MFYWSAVAAGTVLAALVTAGFVVRRRLEHTARDASAPQPPAGGWVQAFIGPYRLPLLLALALVLTATLVDLLVPWSLKVLIDNVVGGDPLPPFLSDLSGLTQHQLAFGAAATGLLLVLINVVLTYLVTYLVGATENLIAADMRAVVFRRLQDLSLRFHDRNRTGDLVSRLTDDVGRVRDAIIAWFESVAPDALTLVGILIIVTIIDPFLTVVSLSVIPLLIYYAFTKRPVIKAAERSARDRRGELATHATDTLRNVRLVQAFSRQRMETDRFRRQLDQTANAEITALDVSARYSPIGSVVLAIGTALVSWIGVVRVVDGRLSLGTLVVFLSYLSGLYGPIRSLSRLVSTFAKGAASRERLVELFDDTLIVRDDPGAVAAGTAATRLVLRDLSFGYEAAAPVLRQVNLAVEPGETVCIVGASGVGKSTLLSLLLRLYEPTAGSITLGGIDIQQLTMESLREHVALVPQAPWIIDGTIGDNILFGRADATDAEFRHATRKALVDEFTARLPRGLDTQVGESGVLLSGGQLRRIALARAVIRNSPVLLLDEPTAGLDAESVAEVMSALKSVGDDRTMVVVSHDLRLAEQADRVAVMVDGTIVESGTHQALLDSQGRYAAMWMIQRDMSDLTIPVGSEREKEVNTLWATTGTTSAGTGSTTPRAQRAPTPRAARATRTGAALHGGNDRGSPMQPLGAGDAASDGPRRI